MPCAPRAAGARDGRANRGGSPVHISDVTGAIFEGNRVCGICRSAQGRSPLNRGLVAIKTQCERLPTSIKMQTNDLGSSVAVSGAVRLLPAISMEAQNLRPAGSQPPAPAPPNQELSLICTSTFNVTSRRSTRDFSLSLTAWYRDTASAASLQRLSRLSQHLHSMRFGPPTPSTPFRVARARYRHSGCYYRSWFQISGSPSVTPTLGASF